EALVTGTPRAALGEAAVEGLLERVGNRPEVVRRAALAFRDFVHPFLAAAGASTIVRARAARLLRPAAAGLLLRALAAPVASFVASFVAPFVARLLRTRTSRRGGTRAAQGLPHGAHVLLAEFDPHAAL